MDLQIAETDLDIVVPVVPLQQGRIGRQDPIVLDVEQTREGQHGCDVRI